MRTSPSGPLAVSDETLAVLQFDQTNQPAAPGEFFVVIVAGVEGAFVPPTDPSAGLAALINAGPRTRDGRILRARLALLANQDTANNGNVVFQWLVNGVAAGEPVTLVWADGKFFADINLLTYQQVVDNGHGAEVDFGEPAWKPGDFVTLKATVASPIAAGSKAFILLSYETTYER